MTEVLSDETLKEFAAEAIRRGLVDVELSDVPPARLASHLLSSVEGRSAVMSEMVKRRHGKSAFEKAAKLPKLQAAIQSFHQAGWKPAEIAAELKISVRTVYRGLKGAL